MPSKLPRRRIPDVFRDAQTYLHLRTGQLETNKRFEESKKPVKEWLKKHGAKGDDGNIYYIFPRPVSAVDDTAYSGVMLKAVPGQPFMFEGEVRSLLQQVDPVREHYARVFKTVEVLDEDELYTLQQEGVISKDQLRGLLHYPEPSYQLWPVEYKEPLEEEE